MPAAADLRAYDGTWDVTAEGGVGCTFSSTRGEISIENGAVTGRNSKGMPVKGSVAADGKITWRNSSSSGSGSRMDYTGQLTSSAGAGTYKALGGPCRGTFTATRR